MGGIFQEEVSYGYFFFGRFFLVLTFPRRKFSRGTFLEGIFSKEIFSKNHFRIHKLLRIYKVSKQLCNHGYNILGFSKLFITSKVCEFKNTFKELLWLSLPGKRWLKKFNEKIRQITTYYEISRVKHGNVYQLVFYLF